MKFNIQKLKSDLSQKRVNEKKASMDDVSTEIGISKATISRVEKGNEPDINSFAKIVTWLGTTPNRYFSTNESIVEDYAITIRNLLPIHYSAKLTQANGIHFLSREGGIKDEKEWDIFFGKVSKMLGSELRELYHNVNTYHQDFIIYVSPK